MMHVTECKDKHLETLIRNTQGAAIAVEELITRHDAFSPGEIQNLNAIRNSLLTRITVYESGLTR